MRRRVSCLPIPYSSGSWASSKMLCELCWRMLRGQGGRQWRGTYDLHFQHHASAASLRESADTSCGICRVLRDDLLRQLGSKMLTDELQISTAASLSMLHDVQGMYRLDFTIECLQLRQKKTFVLKEAGFEVPQFRTPVSSNTSSDEVFGMALRWVSQCSCARDSPRWYPKRLIDLSKLKERNFLDIKKLISIDQAQPDKLDGTEVRVVETSDWNKNKPRHENDRYVTLSHCWGKIEQPLVLKKSELSRFSNGIRLDELPKTFRHAVELASRLPRVGYIWIDSLCIMQDPDDLSDWLSQSAVMHRVYSESFLNISATAAEHSNMGLFNDRKPELLWEDEVNLNIEGIPGMASAIEQAAKSSGWFSWLGWPSWLSLRLIKAAPPARKNEVPRRSSREKTPRLITSGSGLSTRTAESDDIRRCTLIDVSFWDTLVNQAPVNRRGWVLQERLLAPRVLHFCRDQIAWECSEFDAAEGHPPGLPNFRLRSDTIVAESKLKGLDVDKDGARLRQNRLGADTPDPDPHLIPKGVYAFELWAEIVEVYSRTAITNPQDKLIALSGIASWMGAKISKTGKTPYVAGLWRRFLESQLLWRVEPVFRHHDRSFEHLSERPPGYRAPSFSWASVDAHQGKGIIYGEVTDKDILIKVEDVVITPTVQSNVYGQVTKGHITLWGKLRKIKLYEKENGRFGWRLHRHGREIDEEEHTNVYLDCPAADGPSIFNSEETYCLPAAEGERTANKESKYLICLLLLMVNQPNVFRRIGLAKLSPWADKATRTEILQVYPGDVNMPHQGWDENGRHRIRII